MIRLYLLIWLNYYDDILIMDKNTYLVETIQDLALEILGHELEILPFKSECQSFKNNQTGRLRNWRWGGLGVDGDLNFVVQNDFKDHVLMNVEKQYSDRFIYEIMKL